MSSFTPSFPYTTQLKLLNPTYKDVKGVSVKSFEPVDDVNCSFKSFGGTESVVNGVLTVEDTANVETWYRPDITSASRFKLGADVYEVLGKPEDIEQRHQFLKFKVRGVKGGT